MIFFKNQCCLTNSNSKLTLKRDSITTSLLSSVNTKESDILNILNLEMLIRLIDIISQLGC